MFTSGKNVPQEKVQDGAVNDMNDPEPFAKKSKVDFKEESGYEASCENEKDEGLCHVSYDQFFPFFVSNYM